MTDEKEVGGKLTDEQLGLGLDALEKRPVVERGAQKKKPRQPVKEAAAKLIQKALPKAETPQKAAPESAEKQGNGAARAQNEKPGARPRNSRSSPSRAPSSRRANSRPRSSRLPSRPRNSPRPRRAAAAKQAPKAPKKRFQGRQKGSGGRRRDDRGFPSRARPARRPRRARTRPNSRAAGARARRNSARPRCASSLWAASGGRQERDGLRVYAMTCSSSTAAWPSRTRICWASTWSSPTSPMWRRTRDKLRGDRASPTGTRTTSAALPYLLKELNVPDLRHAADAGR